jgi:hypothetical protein
MPTRNSCPRRRHRRRGSRPALPNSRKIYVTGSPGYPRAHARDQPGRHRHVRLEKNPPIYVYDTPAPTPTRTKIDIRAGLPRRACPGSGARRHRELPGLTSEYGQQRLNDPALAELRFNLHRSRAAPRPAPTSRRCTTPAGHHHAGDGIRRHPRKPAPQGIPGATEGLRPHGQQAGRPDGPPAPGPILRRSIPPRSPRNSCATKSPAAAPSSPPTSTTRKSSR